MMLIRVSLVVVVLVCLHSISECSPLVWQLMDMEDTVLEREERSAGSGSGSGSGSGDYPCGDDEDCGDNGIDNFVTTEVRQRHPSPKILSMHVTTTITARYVSTVVVTKIKNRANISLDTDFQFRLSKDAFISDFFMEVDGRIYQAEVKEKEEAQKAYNEARQQGQTAAQVKQRGKDITKFETNINLSPNITATFHLTFQELLRRKNGVFRHKVNLQPKEVVAHLRADVYITEPQGLSFANISWEQDDSLPTDAIEDALTVTRKSATSVHATMVPSSEVQAALSETGLQGDLVITYDVEHDSGAGHIEVVNGYFVHHISPEGLPRTRKNVVFAIDVSGSMSGGGGRFGSKIDQTKLAMSTIIDELRDFDRFNIITFSDRLTHWNPSLVEGTPENKRRAKKFVKRMSASGGTDIFLALEDSVTKLKESLATFNEGLPMIILLTDGEPSSGITDGTEIVKRTINMINGEMALFSLAFGEGADYKLLEKLSGFNQGLARKIYEDANPSLQLEGFYSEVANPLLYNVKIQYSDGAVEGDTLTDNNFISYFEGTEFVVAGKLKEDFLEAKKEISAVVTGNSYDVQLEWKLHKTLKTTDTGNEPSLLKPHQVDDFAQRLWAYVTVKDLLHKIDIALTNTEKNRLKEKATAIALEYKFVTPLTSLIVIKPDDEKNYDDILSTDIVEDEEEQEDAQAMSLSQHYSYQVASNSQLLSGLARRPGSAAASQLFFDPQQVQVSTSPVASAYGDPHFVIQLPEENTTICFEAKGRDGLILNLVTEPEAGLTVNGKLHTFEDSMAVRSYFSVLGFTLGKHQITVTASEIIADIGVTLSWKSESRISFGGFVVTVVPSIRRLVVSSTNGTVLLGVSRHLEHPRAASAHPRKHAGTDHLGLYILDSSGLSDQVDGLIGQFYSPGNAHVELDADINPVASGDAAQGNATMVLDGIKIPMVWHDRNQRKCWSAGSAAVGNLNPEVFKKDDLF